MDGDRLDDAFETITERLSRFEDRLQWATYSCKLEASRQQTEGRGRSARLACVRHVPRDCGGDVTDALRLIPFRGTVVVSAA